MHGLFRVRGFTQDDGHIFCLPHQISDEILGVLDLVEEILSTFGFDKYEVGSGFMLCREWVRGSGLQRLVYSGQFKQTHQIAGKILGVLGLVRRSCGPCSFNTMRWFR